MADTSPISLSYGQEPARPRLARIAAIIWLIGAAIVAIPAVASAAIWYFRQDRSPMPQVIVNDLRSGAILMVLLGFSGFRVLRSTEIWLILRGLLSIASGVGCLSAMRVHRAPESYVSLLLCGLSLILAGVFATVGNHRYKLWREVHGPPIIAIPISRRFSGVIPDAKIAEAPRSPRQN